MGLQYIYRAASGLSHATEDGDETLCGRDVFEDEFTTDAPTSELCARCELVAS